MQPTASEATLTRRVARRSGGTSELAGAEVGDGFVDLRGRVHDERAVARHGLGQGPTRDDEHASGRIRPLADAGIDVPLYWQQWHLRSALLDEVGDAVVARARAVLIPVAERTAR